MSKSMAVCPRDGTPLIWTFAFRGTEFYCLDCGGRFGMFGGRSAEPTPELRARHDELKAEWDEHAGAKLIAAGAWHEDCEKCAARGETHEAHATAEEVAAHEAACAWLGERTSREVRS